MTHTPVPPPPVLSRDGLVVAVATDHTLVRASVRDGRRSTVELPHPAGPLALSADGARAVVGGPDSVTLCTPAGNHTLEVHEPVLRVAVDDDLVGAIVGTELRTWRGDALEPVAALDVGPLAPDGLLADAARGRVLAWGLAGPHAQRGEGERTAVMVELGDDGPRVVWSGEDGVDRPNGFLFPLADGALGAYSREELIVLAPGRRRWKRAARITPGDLESAVASPDGSRVAWMFAVHDEATAQDTGRIRVARLGDGVVDRTLAFTQSGIFSALAVDDTGTVTLATTSRQDGLVVGVAAGYALEQRLRLDVQRFARR